MIDQARNFINHNTTAVTLVVVALLIAALGSFVLRGRRPGTTASEVWFFDPTTGKTFIGGSTDLPPIQSPDGNEAVRAHFFACGPCSESSRFLGYYEKYSPETKQKLEEHREALMFSAGPIPGHFYSDDGKTWHEDGSKEATKIVEKVHSKCPQKLQTCLPEDEGVR